MHPACSPILANLQGLGGLLPSEDDNSSCKCAVDCRAKPNLKWLQESTRLYRYAAGYIQRNNVTDSRMLEQPCKEMAELLDDKAKWIMMTSR